MTSARWKVGAVTTVVVAGLPVAGAASLPWRRARCAQVRYRREQEAAACGPRPDLG